jgi:hypothetical protein
VHERKHISGVLVTTDSVYAAIEAYSNSFTTQYDAKYNLQLIQGSSFVVASQILGKIH